MHLRIAGVARRNIMVDTQKSCQLAGIAGDHLTWPPCCVELTRGALVPTFSNCICVIGLGVSCERRHDVPVRAATVQTAGLYWVTSPAVGEPDVQAA